MQNSAPLLAPELALDARGVARRFGARWVLRGINLQVRAGEMVGLLGHNGCGKSTFMRIVATLLKASAGDCFVYGANVKTDGDAVRHHVGFFSHVPGLYDDLSARENLRLFASLYGIKGRVLASRCDEVLALVNLSDRAGDKPAVFSGGMKRRLNIAAALMHDPQLLILDEPTVGVDPQSRNAIFDTLEKLKAMGRSLIYTSHYMEEVERLADHIVIIDHGKVLADETPAALFLRLPARAALRIDLAAPAPQALVEGIAALPGVSSVDADGASLNVMLASGDDALPVMAWLQGQGCRARHFATARTNLEEIFLNLTGRSLRD